MDVDNHVSRSIYDSLKTSFRTRLDTPPAIVVCLQQGVFPTKRDLYDKAALNARIAQPTAQTSNFAGETESIYPFLSEVVDQDILSRTMLFSEAEDTDGSQRSPLPVQTSRAERKVARDMWNTAPRDLHADISGEYRLPMTELVFCRRARGRCWMRLVLSACKIKINCSRYMNSSGQFSRLARRRSLGNRVHPSG